MYVSLKYLLVNVMYSLDPWWCLCRYCSLGDIGFRCSLKDAVLLLVACYFEPCCGRIQFARARPCLSHCEPSHPPLNHHANSGCSLRYHS